jgi:hypothetical protein
MVYIGKELSDKKPNGEHHLDQCLYFYSIDHTSLLLQASNLKNDKLKYIQKAHIKDAREMITRAEHILLLKWFWNYPSCFLNKQT